MKNKNKTISRFFSLILIASLTFSFLFFARTSQFLDIFSIEDKMYRVIAVIIGFIVVIVGVYLFIKTVQQYRTDDEILITQHADLGVYNKVRNPVYSAILLVTSGLLVTTANFLALGVIGINWLILTILIIFNKEAGRNEQANEDYVEYMLKVNRLVPWFNQFFEMRPFTYKDKVYLEQAESFLDTEFMIPLIGVYFPSFLKFLWFRSGICFITEKGVGFYSYDVFRGHYGQLIAFDNISSLVYGRGMLGYSLRVQASNASINLYFIQKGEFEKMIEYIKQQTDL